MHLPIFAKSLFSSSAEVFTLWATENNEVSQTNGLEFHNKLSAGSFMYIRNRSGTNMKP